MKKYNAVLCILVLAFNAAILRAWQLTRLFDVKLGLIEPNHPVTFVLVFTCAAVALVILLTALRGKPPEQTVPLSLGLPWFIIEVAAFLSLFASGLALLRRAWPQSSAALILYAFSSIVLPPCMLASAYAAYRGTLRKGAHGIIATLSVFWACFTLIIDYWGRAGDPTAQSYLYTLLALLFGALSLLSAGGFFYQNPRPKALRIYGSLALFFSSLALFGILLAMLLSDPAAIAETFLEGSSTSTLLPRAARPPADTLLRLLFIALHSAALCAALRCGLFAKLCEEKPEETGGEPLAPEEENSSGQERETLTGGGENDIL